MLEFSCAAERWDNRLVSRFELTPERVALGRVAAGSLLAAFPRTALSWWAGSTDERASSLVRALGVRDVALGLGALLSLRRQAPAKGWFQAAALADAGDVVATLLILRRAPGFRRFAFLFAALAGLTANQRISASLSEANATRANER